MSLISLNSVMLGLTMDDVYYQVTGMAVVFCCLAFLSVILSISGSVAVGMGEKRRAKAAAAKAAACGQPTAAAPAAGQPSPAEVAALAAGIYNTAKSSITPELVAVIAAAVRVSAGDDARILSIQPSCNSFARDGRSNIMNSHFPKKG